MYINFQFAQWIEQFRTVLLNAVSKIENIICPLITQLSIYRWAEFCISQEDVPLINEKDIQDLFHEELVLIKDADVRAKVVKAWLLGCQRGNWNSIAELEKMPFTLLTPTHGVNFIEHTKAVTKGAMALAQAQEGVYRAMPYKVNFDRLIAGGLLHDVGKLMEIEPDGKGGYRKSYSGKCARHPISGAILAAEIGLSEEIVNTIGCHAKEGEGRPQVLETVFIHQADYATFNPLVMKEKGTLIED